ncbi:hypothetical protein [uncultured Shewanella sp.]|uniref:hypothetical protein n=1 Tax=uncultured Shewanella sp. TaxID=173975 RepID=UPI0026038E87|nr:hypothetical protein [uncultured Shewanella sp.]
MIKKFLIFIVCWGLFACGEDNDCDLPSSSGELVSYQSCERVEFNPLLPTGVASAPRFLSYDNAQQQFECFAWKSFVALNWPAQPACRGVPNLTVLPVDKDSQTVWQGYKKPFELLQPYNVNWRPEKVLWFDDEPVGTCTEAKNTDLGIVYENGFALFGQESVITDQSGNVTFSQVLINPDTFYYLRDNHLAESNSYDTGGPLDDALWQAVNFPIQTLGKTGHGAMELKTTWKVITSSDDMSRYVTRSAMIYIDQEDITSDTDLSVDCEVKTLGLVGFHLIRKVEHAPKWVWATWEHVDNVPDVDKVDETVDYSFYSHSCAQTEPDDCWVSGDIGARNTDTDYLCCANALLVSDFLGYSNQFTRINAIQANAELTAKFQSLFSSIGSPLQYYTLIGAQWGVAQSSSDQAWNAPCNPNGAWRVPTPEDNHCYMQQPETLRSSVTEGYNIAWSTDATQILADSCMNCHNAIGVDGSFIWSNAVLNGYAIDQ